MKTIVLCSLVILLLYVLKILKYKRYWEKYPEFRSAGDHEGIAISVIIAFRNEGSNLAAILSSLGKQVYPADLYEIILVNDHSDDGSDEFVRQYCEKNPNFIFKDNQGKIPGKKSALRTGIETALNDIIVTTDADCTMGAWWLATIAGFFREKNPDLMIGLVDMASGCNYFEKFQEVEFLSLIASGAGAAAGRRSIFCNAACLAFRKKGYLQMNDPLREGIASGDDTFLLHAVKKNKEMNILLLKSFDAVVTTHGLLKGTEYLNQRLRWVSKGRYYSDAETLYTAFIVFMVNAFLLISLVLLCMNRTVWLFPLIFSVKFLTDFFFLQGFMRFFKKELPANPFIVYSLIYPIYAVFTAIAGLLCGYTWKGRRYKPAA